MNISKIKALLWENHLLLLLVAFCLSLIAFDLSPVSTNRSISSAPKVLGEAVTNYTVELTDEASGKVLTNQGNGVYKADNYLVQVSVAGGSITGSSPQSIYAKLSIADTDNKPLQAVGGDVSSGVVYQGTNFKVKVKVKENYIAGDCGDNPICPLTGYKWAADCTDGGKCIENSDCGQNSTDSHVERTTSNWCFGFTGGKRCMKLAYTGQNQNSCGVPAGTIAGVSVTVADAKGQVLASAGGQYQSPTTSVQIALGEGSSDKQRREYLGRETVYVKNEDPDKLGYYQDYDLYSDGTREAVGDPKSASTFYKVLGDWVIRKVGDPDDEVVKVTVHAMSNTPQELSLSGSSSDFDLTPYLQKNTDTTGYLKIFYKDSTYSIMQLYFKQQEIKPEDDGLGGCCMLGTTDRIKGCERGEVCADRNGVCSTGYACMQPPDTRQGNPFTVPTQAISYPPNHGINYSSIKLQDQDGTVLTKKADGIYILKSPKIKISIANKTELASHLDMDLSKRSIPLAGTGQVTLGQPIDLHPSPIQGKIPAICKSIGPSATFNFRERIPHLTLNEKGEIIDLPSSFSGGYLNLNALAVTMGRFLGLPYKWDDGGDYPTTQANEDIRWAIRVISIAGMLGQDPTKYWSEGIAKGCQDILNLKEKWLLDGKVLPPDDELERSSIY